MYDFKAPLEIPLYLAGNFGELRSNHFHGGVDMKTQGREGLNVLASADGYVSRIKVSPYGYGLALYIRHPNGYTTVYGHLKKYNDKIAAYVKRNQYLKKSYRIELFPSPSEFPVKQGELIGTSGNSGGSSAPHLHFEIRETASEAPVNPLLFGFDISDDIPPVLSKLYVYPLGDQSQVNRSKKRKDISIYGQNGQYYLNSKVKIESFGNIGLGISLYDQLNGVPNKCGIYEIKLFQKEVLIYHQKMEKIPFHENRYINALTDFEEHERNNNWIFRNFILPNNKLNVYQSNFNKGIINIPPNESQAFKYEVSDSYGNKSVLNFEISGIEKSDKLVSTIAQKPAKWYKYDRANTYEDENVMVYFPANVLYEDLDFNFWVDDSLPRSLTPVYHIHDLYTPLHSYIALSIKLKNIEPRLKKYCTIVSLDENENIIPEGGYWKGDYIIVKTRSFGPYTVMIDSTRPKLTPINISQMADMSRKFLVSIKAEDNLSGVYKYNAYIDDKWVLTEFDYKRKRLLHVFEKDLSKGKHHFKIVVGDKIGNESVFECDFVR